MGGLSVQEYRLKYGCNPHQQPARVFMKQGKLPFEILNGQPGYINFLDALNAYQLVRELRLVLELPAATSFKHVSPAGAALGLPLNEIEKRAYAVAHIEDINASPIACAYARARGADRMSSFGDFIALSEECDAIAARLIKREVSDGIIAPGYTPEALAILKEKRGGNFSVIRIEKNYVPESVEQKDVFGITFEQLRNNALIDLSILKNIVTKNKELGEAATRDLLLALITLKYTQSNSVCYALHGQTIGVGAGQQSRIHCTRLAGDKADIWWLRRHKNTLSLNFLPEIKQPERDNLIDLYITGSEDALFKDERWRQYFYNRPLPLSLEEKCAHISKLEHVSLGSDAFFPFHDNIERASKSGVKYIAQPGGSVRDADIIAACDERELCMVFTGLRLFHH